MNFKVSLSLGLLCFRGQINSASFDCLAYEDPETMVLFSGILGYENCAAFDHRQIKV